MMIKHLVFFIAYIYFLYNDFIHRKISLVGIAVYAFASLICVGLTKNEVNMNKFIDIAFSVAFGLIIYMLSYFSEEGIGFADAMFFVINGLVLTLKENVLLFFTGMFVAFIIGVTLFFFRKNERKEDIQIPFMPCILPAIIGYIVCIV